VSYPQSVNVQDAKYFIAESHYRLRQYDKALALYGELTADRNYAQGSKVVARIAEIEYKQGQYNKSVDSFHRLEKFAGSKKDQYNAWSGLMESFYLLAQYDSADVYAKLILEKGNVNASAQNKASLYLGKTALARGDFEGAKDEFLNTLNTAQDEYGAEAKYLLAQIFYNQKDYKQCYETLISLNNDFPTYEEWVGKSFLLLSDNFLAQNDIFQARATLQSLIDKFPLQTVKDEARKKLKALEQQELEKQKQQEADTTDN
jgi:TolA-binding protein